MQALNILWKERFEKKESGQLRACLRSTLSSENFGFILHPLGFYCAILDSSEGSKIRLHYWRQQQRETFTAITPFHDHIWKLRSYIVLGEIENIIFDYENHSEGKYQLADISQHDGIDEVLPVPQRINLSVASKMTYREGDFYELEPHIFHCSNVPPNLATITLVHSEVVSNSRPRTLVPLGFQGHDPLRQPVPDSRQIQGEILALIK